MKKITLLSAIATTMASSAFAALTIEPYSYVDSSYTTETFMVTGSGGISDFTTYTYASLYFESATVAFNSSQALTLTSTSQATGALSVSNGSAWYPIVMKNSTLTFSNGGSLITGNAANAISIYKSNVLSTITVEATAGTVKVNKVFANTGKLVFNLYKENSLTHYSASSATLVGGVSTTGCLELNMTANQNLKFDLRNNARATLGITNGAVLTFNGFSVNTSGGFATILLSTDDLSDGKIFFANTSTQWGASSWNAATGALSLTESTKTYTLYFKASDGTTVADLDWVETTGGWYLETPVPEPAAYAAIFGALALGFAAWRKRKQG